jgi:NhaP-type Na+/H+ or K+/H+ antiporter
MEWVLFFIVMAVGFLALGFLLDRIAMRVIRWNEDRKIHKILADEVVRKYQLERLKREQY